VDFWVSILQIWLAKSDFSQHQHLCTKGSKSKSEWSVLEFSSYIQTLWVHNEKHNMNSEENQTLEFWLKVNTNNLSISALWNLERGSFSFRIKSVWKSFSTWVHKKFPQTLFFKHCVDQIPFLFIASCLPNMMLYIEKVRTNIYCKEIISWNLTPWRCMYKIWILLFISEMIACSCVCFPITSSLVNWKCIYIIWAENFLPKGSLSSVLGLFLIQRVILGNRLDYS
jgi:hypothetical protein